jgi:peptidoglycan/xylan/chitin deacetylase (PgdA/CDA1 family)
MSLLHVPHVSSWIRGHLLCRVDEVTDRLALTFDDGPSARNTPAILDLLAQHGAHATFFTLADNVARLPHLVRRMVDEGHEVALHGQIHWPLPLLPPNLLRRELERSALAVRYATQQRARCFRPPFGLMLPSQARYVARMGYLSVLGDIYPEDAHRPGVDTIVERVQPRLAPGSILILHDGSPLGEPDRRQTVTALGRILTHMTTRGLRGVSVAELLAEAPEETQAFEASLTRGGRS